MNLNITRAVDAIEQEALRTTERNYRERRHVRHTERPSARNPWRFAVSVTRLQREIDLRTARRNKQLALSLA